MRAVTRKRCHTQFVLAYHCVVVEIQIQILHVGQQILHLADCGVIDKRSAREGVRAVHAVVEGAEIIAVVEPVIHAAQQHIRAIIAVQRGRKHAPCPVYAVIVFALAVAVRAVDLVGGFLGIVVAVAVLAHLCAKLGQNIIDQLSILGLRAPAQIVGCAHKHSAIVGSGQPLRPAHAVAVGIACHAVIKIIL